MSDKKFTKKVTKKVNYNSHDYELWHENWLKKAEERFWLMVEELNKKVIGLEKTIKFKEEAIQSKIKDLNKWLQMNNNLKKEISDLNLDKSNLKRKLVNSDSNILGIKRTLKASEDSRDETSKLLKKSRSDNDNKDKLINELKNSNKGDMKLINKLRETIKEDNNAIDLFRFQISELKSTIKFNYLIWWVLTAFLLAYVLIFKVY